MFHPSKFLTHRQSLVAAGQVVLLAMGCSSGQSNSDQEPRTAAGTNSATISNPSNGGTSQTLGGSANVSAGGTAATANGGTTTTTPFGGTSAVASSSKAIGGMNGGAATVGSATSGNTSGIAGRTNSSSTSRGGTVTGGASASTGGSVSTRGGTNSTSNAGAGGPSRGGVTSATTSARGGTAGTSSMVGTAGVAGSTLSSILEPATGVLFGLYYGDASIAATSTKLGRTVPLHLTYYAWSDDWTRGDTTTDLNSGRIPFVCWELFGATLDDIATGKYDTMLAQRAASAKQLGKKLFVDLGAEMNGDWSPWSGAENGQSSAAYVAAYRHVHDIFVAAGATNVIWAFCPNVTSVPDASWNEPLDYYPGDSYVDWMCVDGYNWGTSSSGDSWQSFYDVFKKIYPVLASKNKPIIIGEMASTELGGDKAKWISEMIPTMQAQFPLLKGLNWFDVNKETDWRISSSSASEAAFKQMVNDPWFAR